MSIHPSPFEQTICAKQFQWFAPPQAITSSSRCDLRGIRNVRRPYQEPSMPKMRSNDVLADHRAGKAGFRFADFRMPEMLRHRNLRGVDISRNKCLYRATLPGPQAASALAFAINAATPPPLAMP